MTRRKTHKEYVAEVAAVNPNIEVLGAYVGTHVKILHKCKIDDYEWEVRPHDVLQGNGCPKCIRTTKKTHKEYVNEVSEINSNIEVIDTYLGSTIKILHKCKIDGHRWMASPNNILSGYGCPMCGKLNANRKKQKHMNNT